MAVAGLDVSANSRPRAVVLLLAGSKDASRLPAPAARNFLGCLRVPLLIWTVGTGAAEAAAWGKASDATDVSGPKAFEEATRRLTALVDRQRIVWVEGVHVPRSDPETLDTRGHAGGGIAAALAGLTAEETRQTVVHELAHLLSQEVFAREAPPWIAEGLSEDLAWCRADAEGRLLSGTLDSVTSERKTGDRVVRVSSGSRATVKEFLERVRAGRGLPLSGVLERATRLFAHARTRRDAYTQAGLLVRFLLGGDPARTERFRVFLRAAALGAPAGLDALAAALGTDTKSLEKEFWSFVRRQ